MKYLLGSGTAQAKTVRPVLADYLGDNPDAVAVIMDDDTWGEAVAASLRLDFANEEPDYGPDDTVLTAPDAQGIDSILSAGAVVLDVTRGLVPLGAASENSPEVVPDVPDSPVLEAPEETAAPKPKPKRQAKKPATTPKKAESKPESSTPVKGGTMREHLLALIEVMLKEADDEALWDVLMELRKD